MECIRRQDAGQIHDASRGAFMDQRQQSLGQRHRSEQVGFEGFFQGLCRRMAGRILSPAAIFCDPGIVDENVELAELILNKLYGRFAVFRLRHIQF